MNKLIKIILCSTIYAVLGFGAVANLYGQQDAAAKAKEAFSKPGLLTQKELYNEARKAYASGKLDEARLYALRIFMNGTRNQNLLNLLGVIELQAGNELLASEWIRRASSLKLTNKVGNKYLSRLPKKVKPIPVDSAKLADHFSEITNKLPELTEKLTNSKLHRVSIMKALERGQIYFALAIAEEYERKYKDGDGPALTALCAWYLGRNKDALNLVEQNLRNNPYNPLSLFVKAMIMDGYPATSSVSYFRALYDLDLWEKVFKLADNYSKANPNDADAYIVKTRILLDMNRTKEAAESLEEAGKRDPGSPEVEMLWVNFLLQRGEPDKALKHLKKAARRGYNIPAVNLAFGLFAIQSGKINELTSIVNDAYACRPFSDQDAYSNYVSILMVLEQISEARAALDEWKERFPEKSVYCYLESFYYFKQGNAKQALFWLHRAFKHNPNRLDMLKLLVSFPSVAYDKPLLDAINARLAKDAKPDDVFLNSKISNAEKLPPVGGKAKKNTSPVQNKSSQVLMPSQFDISIEPNLDEASQNYLVSELDRIYGLLAAELGEAKKPIPVDIVSADGKGTLIASTDNKSGKITVTTNYFNNDMVKNIISANIANFSDEELYPLIEEYPGCVLAAEIAKKLIHNVIPGSSESKEKNYWMQVGLSDILAAGTSPSNLTLRYRLLFASRSIDEKFAAFTSVNSLNVLCDDSYSSPAVSETARAQAYLMTAYLIKQAGYKQGCQNMLELIKQTSSGKEFNTSLKNIFGITEADFDKNWREAATWALSQGTPYEWE